MDAEKKLIKDAKSRFPKGSEFIDLSSYIPKGEERKAISTGKFCLQNGNVFTYHDNYHYLGAMCYSAENKKWSKKTLNAISNKPTPKEFKKVYDSVRRHYPILEIQHMKCIIEELYKIGFELIKK